MCIYSKLQLSQLISYIRSAWTSHTRLLVIRLLTQLHMVRLEIFNYRCQITLTPYLNSSYVITLNFLATFKLLIFTLSNFSLSISTLLTRKVSRIWEVIGKRDAIVAMLLDQLYNISDFVIDFSPSLLLLDGVKSKDGLKLGLRVQTN